MAQKFNKTKEFKQLESEWRNKLKDSGFEDIEDADGNIARGSWDYRTKKVINSYKTKVDYYYMATQFLNDYNFETPLDKAVWAYHIEGIGVRDIAKLLQDLKMTTLKRMSISYTIIRLRKQMHDFYLNKAD